MVKKSNEDLEREVREANDRARLYVAATIFLATITLSVGSTGIANLIVNKHFDWMNVLAVVGAAGAGAGAGYCSMKQKYWDNEHLKRKKTLELRIKRQKRVESSGQTTKNVKSVAKNGNS